MAAGGPWWGGKYSYGVWERFADQENQFLKKLFFVKFGTPPIPPPPWGYPYPGGYPKIDNNMIFQKWAGLVGKTFPHPVGVFCGIPGPPSGHIGQKNKLPWFFGFFPLTPIGSLKGPCVW